MGDLKSIRCCTFLWVCKSGYIRDVCRVLVSVGEFDRVTWRCVLRILVRHYGCLVMTFSTWWGNEVQRVLVILLCWDFVAGSIHCPTDDLFSLTFRYFSSSFYNA